MTTYQFLLDPGDLIKNHGFVDFADLDINLAGDVDEIPDARTVKKLVIGPYGGSLLGVPPQPNYPDPNFPDLGTGVGATSHKRLLESLINLEELVIDMNVEELISENDRDIIGEFSVERVTEIFYNILLSTLELKKLKSIVIQNVYYLPYRTIITGNGRKRNYQKLPMYPLPINNNIKSLTIIDMIIPLTISDSGVQGLKPLDLNLSAFKNLKKVSLTVVNNLRTLDIGNLKLETLEIDCKCFELLKCEHTPPGWKKLPKGPQCTYY